MLAQIIKKIPLYISVFIICLFVFLSIFSYFITPDKTTNANSINLIIKSKKPGFKKKFFENVSNEYKLKDFNEAESQYLRIINEYPTSVFSEPIRFHIRRLEKKNL